MNRDVCISIEALYDKYGNNTSVNTINVSHSNGCEYYDLYNKDGELACMDGETVTVFQENEHFVSFVNKYGETDVFFDLTPEEAETAIVKI